MIEVENISITLSGREVVSNLSFQARPGQLTAIIGPNGSGKTTTMKAISGERKFGGAIRFNGRDLTSMSSKQLALSRAVLAQSISLGFPFLVREVLEMGIVAGDTHDAEQAERAMAKALEAVDLKGFETRVATRLSGGEQARLHMARVLCQIPEAVGRDQPHWLLLDEPVASLDIRHQLAIMRLARDFAARGGGVIAVMHDLNLTAMFADHVVMLKAGRLHGAGAPADVFTEQALEAVYGCRLSVSREPESGLLRIVTPLAA
ncbi:MAG: heme ABC transporter ATP-binding protein [Rhizobium sp.]|nr:heme ABC transporter ATP-binding protein [Rhizobium sp.]